MILPFNSFTPMTVKRGIIIGEIRRAIHRASNAVNKCKSLQMVMDRFISNGYPPHLLKSLLLAYFHPNSSRTNENSHKYIYIKTPYINEYYKRKLSSILNTLQLSDFVRFYYVTPNLSKIFHPPKECVECEPNCYFCSISTRLNLCHLKNIVYIIHCTHCHLKYIGQTARLLKTRIHEHLTQNNSAVKQHWTQFHSTVNIQSCFSFNVLHKNLNIESKRIAVESLYIHAHKDNLMNGCVSTQLFVFS